jgi:heat-inducible transcriptional repressor
MLPRREKILLKHVEFLPLSGNRILVILVLNGHEVQNRVIYTARPYSPIELQQAANFINITYSDHDILLIRDELLAAMERDRENLDLCMQAAIEVGKQAFDAPKNTPDYILAGQHNLFEWTGAGNFEGMRQLFDAFAQKQAILHLLDQCLSADGVQIFIGEELGHDFLEECSIVTAPYKADGKVIGVLGVIGPTRMSYDRVIPIVDMTAKLLSAALNPER